MTWEEIVKWLESLKSEIGTSEHSSLWHYAELIDLAIETLLAEQTEAHNNIISTLTSVVEVVRCKDCKHYVSDGGAIMYCEHTDVPTATSDYCSYGEREDNE